MCPFPTPVACAPALAILSHLDCCSSLCCPARDTPFVVPASAPTPSRTHSLDPRRPSGAHMLDLRYWSWHSGLPTV